MVFALFWLPQTMNATALCLAMNSANDASVISLPVYESRATHPVWAARRLGGISSEGGPAPRAACVRAVFK